MRCRFLRPAFRRVGRNNQRCGCRPVQRLKRPDSNSDRDSVGVDDVVLSTTNNRVVIDSSVVPTLRKYGFYFYFYLFLYATKYSMCCRCLRCCCYCLIVVYFYHQVAGNSGKKKSSNVQFIIIIITVAIIAIIEIKQDTVQCNTFFVIIIIYIYINVNGKTVRPSLLSTF